MCSSLLTRLTLLTLLMLLTYINLLNLQYIYIYIGASFDDGHNGKGTYQAMNICSLARYGMCASCKRALVCT